MSIPRLCSGQVFKNKLFRIFSIIFIVLILAWVWVWVEERENEFLEIDFYDVGQGDAIFIETPNNKQILIDGGPDLTILEKLGHELPFWDRYIDLVVLTHPEEDQFKVGTLFLSLSLLIYLA